MNNIDPKIIAKYRPVIGLEIHCQLSTIHKMFSPEQSTYGELPNTQVSQIAIAHPGVMPSINKKAIELAIKMGLACKCTINKENFFARKNYYYPDLPKGYQITQHEGPICSDGELTIEDEDKKEITIKIGRIHLEEDTGKSIKSDTAGERLVDFNRAGTPLIEIVTEPDISNSTEAYHFLTELRRLVRYLDVSDGNMEEGSLRCDVNVSVMPVDSTVYGQKVEVKNLNSITNVKLAIEYEILRQIDEIEKGNKILHETRNYDAARGITLHQRIKETQSDYRYYIEPDLCPVIVDEEWIEKIKQEIPTLPQELYKKLIQEDKLPPYDAKIITGDKNIASFYAEIKKHTQNFKAIANWILGPIKSILNEKKITLDKLNLSPKSIADIIELVSSGKVSFSNANQKIFPLLITNTIDTPLEIAQRLNIIHQADGKQIDEWIDSVLHKWPEKVRAYKEGKKGLLGFFMGEILKASKGKADPKIVSKSLKNKLDL